MRMNKRIRTSHQKDFHLKGSCCLAQRNMTNPNIAKITPTSDSICVVELTNGSQLKIKTTTDSTPSKSYNAFDWIIVKS